MSKIFNKTAKKIIVSLIALVLSFVFFTLSLTSIIIAQKCACAYTSSYQASYEKYFYSMADNIATGYANLITDLRFPDTVAKAKNDFHESDIGIKMTRYSTYYYTTHFDDSNQIYSNRFYYIYSWGSSIDKYTPVLCSGSEFDEHTDQAYSVKIDISAPSNVTPSSDDIYYEHFKLFEFLYNYKYLFIAVATFSMLCIAGIILYMTKINGVNSQPVCGFERLCNKPISTVIHLITITAETLLTLLFLKLVNDVTTFNLDNPHSKKYIGLVVTSVVFSIIISIFIYELVRRILQHSFFNRLLLVQIYNKVGVFGKGIVIGSIIFILLITAFILSITVHPVIILPFIIAIFVLWIFFNHRLSKLSTIIDSYADGEWDDCLIGNPLIIGDIYRNMNKVSTSMQAAVAKSIRNERTKTELITNVSHDIKTPLTSIINYTDLLKREDITEDERKQYLNTLSRNSARMKKLIEDLIEASKASTGNIELNMMNCNVKTLISQSIVEHSDNAVINNLKIVCADIKEDILIYVDGSKLYRVFDNILGNACKYSLAGSRIYVSAVVNANDKVNIIFKNTSEQEITISPDELTERFVRGDMSRHSEGSGLGLAISKNLTELMKGTLAIDIDGDQFKVTLSFPKITSQ